MPINTKKHITKSVLFEMLSSFASLANTLNLSHTTKDLGISRQTVRRHIRDLEEMRGEVFFDFHERKYSLTEAGRDALIEAEALLERTKYWTSGQANNVNGLYSFDQKLEDGTPFFQQRHPLASIWKLAPPLIVEGFKAWASSGFQIEAPEMEAIRPFLVAFRKRGVEWICTEVGDRSAIATWHGAVQAQSSIGATFGTNPIATGASIRVMDAYETVSRTGGMWYDHIFTRQNRHIAGAKQPVSYQRLIFYCEFPDGQPAAACLSTRTNQIKIDNLPASVFEQMPKGDLMDTTSSIGKS